MRIDIATLTAAVVTGTWIMIQLAGLDARLVEMNKSMSDTIIEMRVNDRDTERRLGKLEQK